MSAESKCFLCSGQPVTAVPIFSPDDHPLVKRYDFNSQYGKTMYLSLSSGPVTITAGDWVVTPQSGSAYVATTAEVQSYTPDD